MSAATIELWNTMVHPAADRYPLLDDSRLAEMAEDIAANGQREPIWVDVDGFLIDGRNRLEACRLAGVPPRFEMFEGHDVEAFVVSKNEHRRDLTPAVRMMLRSQREQEMRAQGMSTRAIAEAVGVSKSTVATDLQVSNDRTPEDEPPRSNVVAERRAQVRAMYDEGLTQAAIAEQLGVSPSTVCTDYNALGIVGRTSKSSVVERWERVRELATGSRSRAQIAVAVGLSEEALVAGCKQRGITIATDAVMRNKRRGHDSNEVVDRVVLGAEIPETVLDAIDYGALDVGRVADWVSSLEAAIRSLNTIKKALKELTREEV